MNTVSKVQKPSLPNQSRCEIYKCTNYWTENCFFKNQNLNSKQYKTKKEINSSVKKYLNLSEPDMYDGCVIVEVSSYWIRTLMDVGASHSFIQPRLLKSKNNIEENLVKFKSFGYRQVKSMGTITLEFQLPSFSWSHWVTAKFYVINESLYRMILGHDF